MEMYVHQMNNDANLNIVKATIEILEFQSNSCHSFSDEHNIATMFTVEALLC